MFPIRIGRHVYIENCLGLFSKKVGPKGYEVFPIVGLEVYDYDYIDPRLKWYETGAS
jgi:hypothetical protein